MNEDKATRYQRQRRRTRLAGAVWDGLLLLAVVASGASAALRDAAGGLAAFVAPTGVQAWATVAAYGLALLLVRESGATLIAFIGYSLDRRYGQVTERPPDWVRGRLRTRAIVAVGGVAAATLLYACIRWLPAWWWLPAGVAFAGLRFAAAHLVPVWFFRLLHDLRPLERHELRRRLDMLVGRVGAARLSAYAWQSAEAAREPRAVLAGLGATRAIFISQAMLDDYTDEEIEVVAAHELAHHVHGDLWKGLAAEAIVTMAGLWVAAASLAASGPVLGLAGPADVAGLPIVVLSAGAVSVALRPLVRAFARAAERRADRVALDLTGNPQAFISVVRRLASRHMTEDAPSRTVAWLWHEHPPAADRIAFARAFRPEREAPAHRVERTV